MSLALKSRNIAIAGAIGLGLMAISIGLSAIPHFGVFGILSAPGLIFAALFFSEGIHSDNPYAYITIASGFDVLLYGFLSYFIVRWIRV